MSGYTEKRTRLLPFITTPPIYRNDNNSINPPFTTREYEEQIYTLKMENFNLKLRIFYLEENNPFGLNNSDDANESFFKENVNLKVESEMLRQELHEKQHLLCEAAKAMDLMDENRMKAEKIAKDQILFLEV